MPEAKQLQNTDILRFYAILGVITIHVASPGIKNLPYGSIEFWGASLWDAYARASVPIFFMITGYIFLNRKDSIRSVFSRTTTRIGLPLLAWSSIYIIFSWIFHKKPITAITFIDITRGPVYFHLWYLYAALFIYLCIPLLQRLNEISIAIYFCTIWFTLHSMIPLLNKLGITNVEIGQYYTFFTGYVGYLFIGYLISKIKLSRIQFLFSLMGSLILPIGIAASTYFLNSQTKTIDEFFLGYTRPLTILYSTTLFATLNYIYENFQNKIPSKKVIRSISECSFGIYLVHIIIYRYLDLLPETVKKYLDISTSIGIFTKILLILAASWLTVLLIKKIPLANKLT